MIAEAGANHNRDLGIAKELIDVAAAPAPTRSSSRVHRRPLFGEDTALRVPRGRAKSRELLDAIALPREWQPELADHASDRGIAFFSTPFDHDAVEALAAVGVPAMKIASFELVDLRYRGSAAAVGVPVILSTGMATYGDIEDALGALAEFGNREVALLRCASLYPAPAEIMNLRAMATMREAFGVPVGLSDHTTGIARSDRRGQPWGPNSREALHARAADEGSRPSVCDRA